MVLLPRLEPPPRPARVVERPRVDTLLAAVADYPITLVLAPAGGGKTIALAHFTRHCGWPFAWCRLDSADTPALLALHLAAAFRGLVALDEPRLAAAHPVDALDLLINALTGLDDQTLLILDDLQVADRRPELRALLDHLLARLPQQLRLVLLSREEPTLALLPTIEARGELQRLSRADLAFTAAEARALFDRYGMAELALDAEFHLLARGWPLALRLFAATRAGPNAAPVAPAELGPFLDLVLPQLEQYLEREALGDLPFELRAWLLTIALMRWIDESAGAALAELVHEPIDGNLLARRELFIETLPDGRRAFQPLPALCLARLAQRELPDWRAVHHRLGDYYAAHDDDLGAVHHLAIAGAWEPAVAAIYRLAASGLTHQQAGMLLAWIDAVPSAYQGDAALLEARAIAELRVGHYGRAVEAYRLAEADYRARRDLDGQVRALRGQAEVFLDTVQPAPAAALLRRALKLAPRERRVERAGLLSLQAENWVNRGRADVARLIASAAQREAFGIAASREAPLPARLLLRGGRLIEARRALEDELGLDGARGHGERLFHRNPLLLLALIECLLGNGVRALALAQRALLEAQRGESRLSEAIAHMRLGHAYLVTASNDDAARRHYQVAQIIAETIGVARTRAEVMLGLTLLDGHAGNLDAAEASAREGVNLAQEAGDEWTAALLWLALGGVAAAAEDPRAAAWIDEARQRFARGDDRYGQTVALLWDAHIQLRAGREAEADRRLGELFTLVRAGEFDGLLTTRTLFGPRDLALLLPLLLRGSALRGAGQQAASVAQYLLRQGFPSIAADDTVDTYHPGYTLRVHLLGQFRVFRGAHEIQAREWQREKARQLLQLLLTYRGMWLQREQICAWLWPESEPAAAERQFKVTLNTLNNVLEPQRPPRVAPFFIRRQGLAYSFAPSYGCWIDVDEFELRTAGVPGREQDVEVRNRRIAFQLYRGDYLAEALYDPWTLEERERLLARQLGSAATLARLLLERAEYDEAIEMCEQILRRDRGYEEAFQMLIRAYARAGNRSLALRVYTRCVQALRDELGLDPLPETGALYEAIKRGEAV